MPLFTVCIPTYNRADLIRQTLGCLLQQTYRDFDIIISDNASTDNTAEVVSGFADSRIRYVRQQTLLSPSDNWVACAEMTQTAWTVFNQDDDLLCPYFLERCARAIERAPHIVMYAAQVTIATDVTRLNHGGFCCGVPLRHHWDQAQPRLIPGVQIAALAWFVSAFSPPALAAPTALFLKHWPRGPEAIYLGEHYLISRMACEGTVAYEGYVGAIMREHGERLYRTALDVDRLVQERTRGALSAFFADKKIAWQAPLREIIAEFPLSYREWLLDHHLLFDFISPQAMDIVAASVAGEKGVPAINYVENLRAERLRPAEPAGRLDRWNVPKPMTRVIRGLLYAMGKDY